MPLNRDEEKRGERGRGRKRLQTVPTSTFLICEKTPFPAQESAEKRLERDRGEDGKKESASSVLWTVEKFWELETARGYSKTHHSRTWMRMSWLWFDLDSLHFKFYTPLLCMCLAPRSPLAPTTLPLHTTTRVFSLTLYSSTYPGTTRVSFSRPGMIFTKTAQKFGQWPDVRANTHYGLGFGSEQELNEVRTWIQRFEHESRIIAYNTQVPPPLISFPPLDSLRTPLQRPWRI